MDSYSNDFQVADGAYQQPGQFFTTTPNEISPAVEDSIIPATPSFENYIWMENWTIKTPNHNMDNLQMNQFLPQEREYIEQVAYNEYDIASATHCSSHGSYPNPTYQTIQVSSPPYPPVESSPPVTAQKKLTPARRRKKPGVEFCCPFPDCSTNRNMSQQGFDRNDNLLAHLRMVHKMEIPKLPAGRPRKSRVQAIETGEDELERF